MRSPWSAPRVRVALRGDLGSADRGLSGLLGEWDDRGGVGAAARLPLREHNLTVDDHIELTEPAEPDLWCDAERAGKAIAKAHGLLADVASDEAALDLDVHGQSVTWCGRQWVETIQLLGEAAEFSASAHSTKATKTQKWRPHFDTNTGREPRLDYPWLG